MKKVFKIGLVVLCVIIILVAGYFLATLYFCKNSALWLSNKAKEKVDLNICYKISSKSVKNLKYCGILNRPMAMGDISRNNQTIFEVSVDDFQTFCLYNYARHYNDVNLCRSLDDEYQSLYWYDIAPRNWCLILVGHQTQNATLCDELSLTQRQEEKFNMTIEDMIERCREFVLGNQYYIEQGLNKCDKMCEDYISGSCDNEKAVAFCKERVELDIDGNSKEGEYSVRGIQHGGVIDGVPFCEDGYYCFNLMKNCTCEGTTLTPDDCDEILCKWYMGQGLSEEAAKESVIKDINTGTCNISTNYPKYGFLDRDTVMGSGKNWFDIFGMGDCQKD
ncbi:hypothetical protein A3K63_01050 [Candidatus Micrarchaeota archaeon RBG_16_49_10]|nr:MAG: hypothetical protein A3K63_01050 [Candidatus Micrarchaeota archaeon RBG_16_49_10]